MHVEIQYFRSLQPGIADVIGVADPCDRLALNRTAMLDEGVDVGEYLTGMVFVGQAIDDRYA